MGGNVECSPERFLGFFETMLNHKLFSLVAFHSFLRPILEKLDLRRLQDMA